MIKKNFDDKKIFLANKKKFLINQKKFFDMQNHYKNETWMTLFSDDAVNENNSYFIKSMNVQSLKKSIMIDDKKTHHVNNQKIKTWRKHDNNIH